MAPEGIWSNDWAKVHGLAVAAANAESDQEIDAASRRMRLYLEDLRHSYGDVPALLATMADYCDTSTEAEALLLEAYDSARQQCDEDECALIAMSLAELYTTGAPDRERATLWLNRVRVHLPNTSRVDLDEVTAVQLAIESMT